MGLIINPRQIIKDGITSLRDVWSSSKVSTELSGKQATLVSGTNIKTINNTSLLGSGDITINADIPKINMTATTATLEPNKFYVWGEVASLDISLAAETAGIENIYKFQFQSGDVATSLILDSNIVWNGVATPNINPDSIYIVTIQSSVAKIERSFQTINYIQDGLVLHLDGLSNGGFEDKWIDLVSSRIYNAHGNVIRIDNGYSFGSGGYMLGDQLNDVLTTAGTIECVFKDTGSASSIPVLFCNNKSGNIVFSYNRSQKRVFISNNSGFTNKCLDFSEYSANIKFVISCSVNVGAVNKLIKTPSGSDYITSNGNMSSIANFWNNNNIDVDRQFIGEIYAIRVYNRQLSANEIFNNQEIDNQRFNLGL